MFLHEAAEAGLTSGIIDAAKIVPLASVPDDRRRVALDLVWDRREYDADGTLTYDPLAAMLDLFDGVDSAALKDQRAAELAALPVNERLERRIIDGEAKGLEEDLDLAREGGLSALQIINDHLLEGMKVVGERFGSGEMQLPFVLQSAEVMKTAVALLEPHMEKSSAAGKGTIVLATVRGDVHDIGKNLVDIILTNNGYDVINLGIKQPIADIIAAAEEHDADVIGMSGLLVKSTVVMKENLQELQSRGLAKRWPVILGGAALTRAYVERRSRLAVRRRGALRPRRVRGARAHGAAREDRARGASPSEVGLPALKKRIHAAGRDSRSPSRRPCPVVRTWPPTTPCRRRRSGEPGSSAAWRSPTTPRSSTSGDVHGAVGTQARSRGGRSHVRAARPERGSAEAAVLARPDPRGGDAGRVGRVRVLPRRGGGRGSGGAAPRRRPPAGALGVPGLLAPDGGSGGAVGADRLRFTFPRQRRDRHLCLSDSCAHADPARSTSCPCSS